jgi:taurine dioxygenase
MSAALENTFETISVSPMSPTIGAEIGGVRMSGDVTDEQIAEIRQALLDWKVIFFRDQDVTDDEHVAFGRRFGELEIHPFGSNHKTHPEILIIHHAEDSKAGQNGWHSDVTWRDEPSLGSILRGKIIPAVGGDTLFVDMYAAYDALPDDIKERIDNATAEHSFIGPFGGRMDAEEEESDRLLRRLYRQATVPEFQCRFRWQTDSVAFWDNRAVQHYAAFDYPGQVRRVQRVTVIGDKPY